MAGVKRTGRCDGQLTITEAISKVPRMDEDEVGENRVKVLVHFIFSTQLKPPPPHLFT